METQDMVGKNGAKYYSLVLNKVAKAKGGLREEPILGCCKGSISLVVPLLEVLPTGFKGKSWPDPWPHRLLSSTTSKFLGDSNVCSG